MNIKLWWQIHHETRRNSYYLSPSHHRGGVLVIVAKRLKMWIDAIRMPWNKKYNVQQYPGERKSKLHMLLENVVWAWKYCEPCEYYFAYGLDLKKHNPNDYLGYSEFRMMRNILNIRQRENLQTGYTFNYLALTRDKFVFYQYCKSLGMPYPKTIALVHGGEICWYDEGIMTFAPMETIKEHSMDAFCKETTGELGKGAFTLKVENGKIYVLGKLCELKDLCARFEGATYIIQEKLCNHKTIRDIYPTSLNTLRIHTYRKQDGTVEYTGAQLRFGAGGNYVDNAGQGGFFVGVDLTGILMNEGYFEPGVHRNIIVHEKHPDTNKKFAGLLIPYWEDLVARTIEFHKFMYGIPSMGWDVAVTENGFVFTEAGEDWEIQLPQCTYGGQREHFYRTHGEALNVKLRRY